MEGQDKWPLPQNPFHCIYTPELYHDQENSFHPVLGYPVCPLIGRYNKGQYQIGQVILIAEFKCFFKEGKYYCGENAINVPDGLVEQLRTIPQVIPHNKPKSQQKNDKIPDVHPVHFKVRDQLSVSWIISLGKIGKDFLNYLNHPYIFTAEVFFGQKLKLTTHNLPIISYFPQSSGLQPEEVERGICMTHFRSQYLSVHLKGGSPAFSPNNMRVGILGMKKKNQEKKEKQKGKGKNKKWHKKEENMENKEENMEIKEENVENKEEREEKEEKEEKIKDNEKQKDQFLNDLDLDWEELQKEIQNQKNKPIVKEQILQLPEKAEKLEKNKQTNENQGFVHFYTSVLLEEEYKVFYHWHISDNYRKEIILQLMKGCKSVQALINGYMQLVGMDGLAKEAGKLINIF